MEVGKDRDNIRRWRVWPAAPRLNPISRTIGTGMLIFSICLVSLAGCSFEAPILPTASATALLSTPAPEVTQTEVPPTVTPTKEPTAEPEPTETAIPSPTVTATPAPTIAPELADLSYCQQTFGPQESVRFSARLVGITAEKLPLVDRVTLTFSDTTGLIHGSAGCIEGRQWAKIAGLGGQITPGADVLAIQLDDWAHDTGWSSSLITTTMVLTGTTIFDQVSFSNDPLASRGQTIGIGVRRPLPFRIQVAEQPARIIIEVDREAQILDSDDPLTQPAGRVELPDRSIFFLQNYDVWRWSDGQAQPLTTTADLETALAVSPDGETLAVCRAPADSEPSALPYDVRASLWVMDASGGEERLLADVGGCADIQFAPSGKTISFTANIAASPPAVLSIWAVPVVVGDPQRMTPVGDQWSRYDAQWLPDSRLIYRGQDDSGLSVLFVREDDGSEREISAHLLTASSYSGIGQVVVGTQLLAIEALRDSSHGADLVLMRFDGTEVAVERRGFWQRPLAFSGTSLFYLLTTCPSNVVQEYVLVRRDDDGSIRELLQGKSLASVGDATMSDDLLVLNSVEDPDDSLRGPRAIPSDQSTGTLMLLTADGIGRRQIHHAPVPLRDVRVPTR